MTAGVQPIPVQVSARGHARRDPRVCSVVPIRLEFAKKDLAGTVFEGQKELKLVTHCDNSSDGEQSVLTEYLTYRIFNLFTPRSFRARLVRVTYVDPKRDKAPVPRYGMILENDEDVARRMEGRLYTDSQPALQLHRAGIAHADDAAAVHDRQHRLLDHGAAQRQARADPGR